MTILIVPSWYMTETNETLGSFFREQALMLAKRGVNVIVADATFQGRKDYFSKRCFKMIKSKDQELTVYSYVIPALGLTRLQNGGVDFFYNNLYKIYKRIEKDGYKIDIIHAHSCFPAGIAATRLGNKLKIPVVVTEHASDVLTKKIGDKQKEHLLQTIKRCNAFISVSNALRKSIEELGADGNNIQVIPNSVNDSFTYEECKSIRKFCFVSIGNLVESKRFDLTIKAFARKFRENPNVQLKIIGDGNLRKMLQEMTKQLGIEDKVTFTGRISRKQVISTLQESKVFVLPSDFETFGVVYIEAMACGLPVIGTKNGGAQEIITENCGKLIERDDLNELSEAMENIYNNYNSYDRKNISEYCRTHFGEEQIYNKLLDVYKELMQ